MGWQFTVTVPSWTQTAVHGQELVVFYRVEVRVQSSESASVAKSRSVLRRFTHFLKLFEKLKEELGARTLAGKEPPSKRTLVNINKRPDLIEGRRRELEQWMWRLVSDPLVARSRVLNKFLELSVAAKLVEQALAAQRAGVLPADGLPLGDGSGSDAGGGGGAYGEAATEYSEDGTTSHWGDGVSTAPTDAYYHPDAGQQSSASGGGGGGFRRQSLDQGHATAATGAGAANQGGSHQHQHYNQLGHTGGGSSGRGGGALDLGQPSLEAGHVLAPPAPRQHMPPHLQQQYEGGAGGLGAGAMAGPGAAADAHHLFGAATPESRMRLGLRVEDRTIIKKHVVVLQQRLVTVARDLSSAVGALRQEQARSGELSQRVRELESRLQRGTTAAEAELEEELAAERERCAELAHQLEQASLQQDLLRQQAERATAAAAAAAEGLAGMRLDGGGQERRQEEGEGLSAGQEAEAAVAAAREEAAGAREEAASLAARLEAARQEAEGLRAAGLEAEGKWRADLKVLAKEVKSLRRQLAAAQQQQRQQQQQDGGVAEQQRQQQDGVAVEG